MVARAIAIMQIKMATRGVNVGFLAGQAPTEEQPDLDGRFRIMNQPAVGRIMVFDRITMQPVAVTRSSADGTWRVDGLNPGRKYLVVGLDDRGLHNAAVQDWILPALAP